MKYGIFDRSDSTSLTSTQEEIKIPEERKVTPKNIRYGMLVEVIHKDGEGYHSGCKVHFFNNKGVLVGNYYEFLPYERLRLRENIKGRDRQYERFFLGKPRERVKMWFFKMLLTITDSLIRFTQSKMN